MSDNIKTCPIMGPINLVQNPELIKISVIKKKHLEQLPTLTFAKMSLIKSFDLLGFHPLTQRVIYKVNNKLYSAEYMVFHEFYINKLVETEKRDMTNKEVYRSTSTEVSEFIHDLPQIFSD